MPVEIYRAGQADYDEIASLYAEARYGAAIGMDDTVLVARSSVQIIGAVRLCPEQGVMVLRGMQIRTAFQRQGIGARLLAACQPYLDRGEAFCLPYTHLKAFYALSGFEPVHTAALPDFLAERLASYRMNGQDVLAMRRPASSSS